MKKAFFTVELALLMPVIFLAFFSVIELTFYVHDRSVLLSETACTAWRLQAEADEAGQAALNEAELTRHLIASPKARLEQTGNTQKLTVSASALLPVSLSSRREITEKADVRKLDAARTLRLLRLNRRRPDH